jgi:hypothetical protein
MFYLKLAVRTFGAGFRTELPATRARRQAFTEFIEQCHRDFSIAYLVMVIFPEQYV